MTFLRMRTLVNSLLLWNSHRPILLFRIFVSVEVYSKSRIMKLGSFFKSMDHYLNLSFEGKHCWVRASLLPANFFLMEDDYRSIKRGKRFWFRMRNELWIYHFTLYMNLFALWQEKPPCVVSRLFCFYLTQASFFILDFHVFFLSPFFTDFPSTFEMFQ